tara:strand:- start:47 stop:793 length:747 start_codon:yes stop_codon:yes gene_type:complete
MVKKVKKFYSALQKKILNMFYLNKKETRLVILQRIELLSNFFKKVRKLFGRRLFTNFISKFFLNPTSVGRAYCKDMKNEYETIRNYVNPQNKTILSIGGGLGGLELILNKEFNVKSFTFIERNFVSPKIKYGWDSNNNEGYNDLDLLKNFLIKNNLPSSKFTIFDYDKGVLPNTKFDLVISLFSLDYHYDFNIYLDYLKKVSHKNTKIVFDTIRADYFKNIFKEIHILSSRTNTVHKSQRLICSDFLS